MPVRSLTSAVFKWPNREDVLAVARAWATALRRQDPNVARVACIGSYARNDWGVGSDLDVIVVLQDCTLSAVERQARYEPKEIPVPVDLWVYAQTEWEQVHVHAPHLWQRLQNEMLDLSE